MHLRSYILLVNFINMQVKQFATILFKIIVVVVNDLIK